jgi:hypothetical protein
MFDCDTLRGHLIIEEEIADIHVSGPLSTGTATVLFQEDRAGIVLVQERLVNMETLAFEELGGPDYLWQDIVRSNDLGLSGAPCNQLLLVGRTIKGTFSQRHGATSVTFHINVGSKARMHPHTTEPCQFHPLPRPTANRQCCPDIS